MRPKVITGILLILLLTNITATALNATSVSAFVDNASKTENTAADLLKNVDFNETANNAISSTNETYTSLWNFNLENQTNANLDHWSMNFTLVNVGLSDMWGAYSKVERLALTDNGKIVSRVSMGSKVDAVVVDVPQRSMASFVTEVKQDGLSTYVEPSSKYQACMVPNDTYWNLQWGPQKIQADYAWNTTTGNRTVLVCVIDTGIDYKHPDLAKNYVPLGYNWVSNNSNVLDDYGHGTHCAGIIGAVINNGLGIAGLAQVRIMAEKGLDANGFGYDFNLANAIVNATDAGASIISMSWGGSFPSKVLKDALKYAYDHGVLLVAAAGNSGSSQKSYPAAYPDVIAVTATDSSDQLAYFSSYGDWVELAAPGVDIYSTMPTYHVTLNDMGYTMDYSYMSGTSMACPHVAGVAALVWSKFPNMSRDVLRLHLRDTADDLGAPGFDIYYGYGRVNARRAVTEPLPPHDIVIGNLEKPFYIEPGKTGILNASVINYGSSNEINVTVQWLVNSSLVHSNHINMTSGASTEVSLSWTPTIPGNYNVTAYSLPVAGETNTANNIVQGFVYAGVPLKVFVLRSAGTQLVTDAWDALNNNWRNFGNQLIYIDYTTLDKYNITYNDLKAMGADVLIISCAYDPAWEYTDGEIAAIEQYVHEGHGLIVTAGTFYYAVPNNLKLAALLGMNATSPYWDESPTDLLDLLNSSHPLFAGVPNPYTMPQVGTAIPPDGVWSSNELAGGTYVAMGHFNESAIIVYRGLVYISPWLEAIPDYYKFNLQILYNAMTWSEYQKSQHDLVASLQAPAFVFPNSIVLVNATVTNEGVQNESNVNFSLSLIDKTLNFNETLSHLIPLLQSGKNYTMSFSWNQTMKGVYNITAYASPVLGENDVTNNKVTISCLVAPPLIHPLEGTWASYGIEANITGQQTEYGTMLLNYSKYISPYLMNVTLLESISGYPGNMTLIDWTTVNIFNRHCEEGAWINYWFPGMIETNITVGSTINVLDGPAAVIGSEAIVIGTKIADCWKLFQNYPGAGNYTWWYDKTNGLWIKMVATFSFDNLAINEVIMLDNTNIPTGHTPAHELRVTLEAPNFIWLGNSSVLNATVFNYGLNNETNVTLALEINGTTVKLLPVPKLAVNDFRTMSYRWTSPNEAVYNITAFAQPVLGENITSDNTATAMVKVLAVKGYVLLDQTHITNSIDVYSTWITNLQNNGYVVNLYNNSAGGITSTVLEGYDAFVTINARMSYSDAELSAIKEFVDKGGGLLVIGDDYPDIYTNLTAFAGITWTSTPIAFGGYTTNITPHEVTQGVSQVYLAEPTAMMNLNGSAQALVRNNYMAYIMLAVNWHGPGRVMGFADQYSLSNYFIGLADNQRLATNMIAWLCEKDITPPQIFLTAPSNGTMIRTTSITLNWAATDSQSGIDKYSIYRNGQLIKNITNEQFVANSTIQSHTESYTVPNLIEGSYNLTIVAYDKAGNLASAQVTITVDLTPPTIEILTPANNSYVGGVVTINVSSSDAHFDRMELYIDANKAATFNTAGVHTYPWYAPSESYSAHRITLTAYDTAGNNASTTIAVTVDNTPPIGEILAPLNATYIKGTVDITFYGNDANLYNMKLYTNSTIVGTWNASGTHNYAWNTTQLKEGSYIILLAIYDKVGNQFATQVTVKIDNTPPVISIKSPQNGAVLSRKVTINFSATDNYPTPVTIFIYINDAQIGMYSNQGAYSWDTTKVIDGNYTIKVVATDLAGNTEESTLTVTVSNAPPAYVTYTGYVAAGILGFALGVLAVWLLLKRKSLPAPTSTEPST